MRPYVLYIPITRTDGSEFAAGGPIGIKTGSYNAYAGFDTQALAERFCAYWKVSGTFQIVGLNEIGSNNYPVSGTSAGKVVLFKNDRVLDEYFKDPTAFRFDDHFIDVPQFSAN